MSLEDAKTLRLYIMQNLLDLNRTFERSPEDIAPLLHCAITDLELALTKVEQQIRATV